MEDLEKIEKFCTILEEFRSNALNYCKELNNVSYKQLEFSLSSIYHRLNNTLNHSLNLALIVDKNLYQKINKLYDSLEHTLEELSIHKSLYENKVITDDEFSNIKNIILSNGLIRNCNILKNSLDRIINKYKQLQLNDDEIFQPSNIKKEVIIKYLNNSLQYIEFATIEAKEKENLLSYVQQIKAEVEKEVPLWKKVVGGLVITATILSGIADADTAFENINKAIIHIMGSSIQNIIPSIYNNLNINTPNAKINNLSIESNNNTN